MSSSRPRGVIAATATPVDTGYVPDTARLIAHCRALLEGGCDGINLLGTTGEATAFSVEQRLAVMQAVRDAGLPLDRFLVGTGVPALADTVRLTQAACELGFAGALVLPPFFYPDPPAAGLEAYVGELVARASHPRLAIYLYHIPQNTGVPWPIALVAALRARHPDVVVGLKDSAGDLAYARAIVAAVPGFDVFPSSEAALGHADADGFAGCISATANVTASYAQAAWSAQGAAAGETAVRKAGELRAIVAARPLISAVKSIIAGQAGDATWERVCLPLQPLDAAMASELRAAFAQRASQA